MQQTQAEDGTTLIMTEASKESREEFVSESRETKHYEEAEVVRGEDTIQVTESNFQSENFKQKGFEEHHVETTQSTVDMRSETGSLAASQPRRASSSYSDSEPGSGPRSPSPKVSPSLDTEHGHQASSDGESRDTESDKEDVLMKETEQELLDEMIVKDVPASESSTDPAKKFEEALPPSKIESIHEEDSETECPDQTSTSDEDH